MFCFIFLNPSKSFNHVPNRSQCLLPVSLSHRLLLCVVCIFWCLACFLLKSNIVLVYYDFCVGLYLLLAYLDPPQCFTFASLFSCSPTKSPLLTPTHCDAKCHTSVESDGWKSRTSCTDVLCYFS